nr:ABC transporter permease [uncultured Mediterraneibacter sp.]
MLNMIKMDLYRMFHTKALYVIWIVLAVMVFSTTYIMKESFEYTQEMTEESRQDSGLAASEEENGEENVDLGMQVIIPTESGEKVTVFDLVYGNLQGKFVALFLLIFTVLYSAADINSGYIKNIGGQVRSRSSLIISKAISLLVYTVLTMVIYVLFQALCLRVSLGYLEWGDIALFWKYTGVQTALHYALVLIAMALAVILKFNVVSMTISVCLTMNMFVIFYSALDRIIEKLGVDGFQMVRHTVTGKIALLSMNAGIKESLLALGTAAVFGIAALALTCVVFQKRDV